MNKSDRIFIAGHGGLVGSAILRRLQGMEYPHLLTTDRHELDLCDSKAVDSFFAFYRPDYVFLAAAKVGGIYANDAWPADFIRINLEIQTNVIDAAFRHKARKLLFLGSSCIYPKDSPQPMREDYLLTGPLEPTNQWYAIAKIAGIKMCQAYTRQHGFNSISLMPTNLYGPEDNFNPETAHVIPALIYKFHRAKVEGKPSVKVWGSGRPRREFLHVDDLAGAAVFLMNNYDSPDIINVGTGQDISIAELAELIKNAVGFSGSIEFSPGMPDGVSRKLLDVRRIDSLGWKAGISLAEGIRSTYSWFLDNQGKLRM